MLAEVATDDQADIEFTPGLQILRVDPSQFDPWFIAGALSQTINRHAASRASRSSGSTPRTDLRRFTIPVIALAEQQKYGQALRRLTEFRTKLVETLASGTALAHEISDGLTSGALTIHLDDESAPTQARAPAR